MRQKIYADNKTDEQGNPSGGAVSGTGLSIFWQNGPLGRGEDRKQPNGAFVEGVIEAAAQRLEFFQGSEFASVENAAAIACLRRALDILDSRTAKRQDQGVEGTHKTHRPDYPSYGPEVLHSTNGWIWSRTPTGFVYFWNDQYGVPKTRVSREEWEAISGFLAPAREVFTAEEIEKGVAIKGQGRGESGKTDPRAAAAIGSTLLIGVALAVLVGSLFGCAAPRKAWACRTLHSGTQLCEWTSCRDAQGRFVPCP